MFKRLAIVFCCATLFFAIPAVADQWDKQTTVTFSQPVELPGIVLPAGTYVFRLLNSAQNRHIVQVYNREQDHLFTTILAIPNYRLTPSEKTVLGFAEQKRGNPEAVRAWFYPADNFGQEFVYPKKRALELAETSHVPVLTAPVTPAEKPEQLVKEPVMAVTPENKEIEVAQVIPPRPAEPPPAPPLVAREEPLPPVNPTELLRELPKTGSQLPLLVVLGLGSLAIALTLKTISRRS